MLRVLAVTMYKELPCFTPFPYNLASSLPQLHLPQGLPSSWPAVISILWPLLVQNLGYRSYSCVHAFKTVVPTSNSITSTLPSGIWKNWRCYHSDWGNQCLRGGRDAKYPVVKRIVPFKKKPLTLMGTFQVVQRAKQSTYKCKFDPWVRKILWRRKWQPTPVFLPGKSHGRRRLEGCSPWGCKKLDITLATKQQ